MYEVYIYTPRPDGGVVDGDGDGDGDVVFERKKERERERESGKCGEVLGFWGFGFWVLGFSLGEILGFDREV